MDKSSRVWVQVDERYDDRAAAVERMNASARRGAQIKHRLDGGFVQGIL
jgi:hypothetical protein